ncbi:hypothetical protein [Algoriphagus aquimarinus]|uniref:Uncharacterized protein n=1 Tax=Algoriphagus aquimarinus TaxID=237018 RepID=A0A1I0VAN8_9BACT|nr:hypothetical protein [Algoriphagus aquimarinus]SFA73328.1 hypothetical protein SAMN04489723_10198 [Algoriphagus aquimarinus]
MIASSKVSFKKIIFFGISVLGMCAYAGDTMAQSEKEKSEMDNVKPIDKPLMENHTDILNDNHLLGSPSSSGVTVTTSKISPLKKDNLLSGEGKKAEPAPSTLSFNIFLYIVDKFKAD